MQSSSGPGHWLAHARYRLAHLRGLLRRGLASLRSRGWRTTWQRALLQLRPPPPPPQVPLYRPEPAPFAPFAVPAAIDGAAPRASIVIPVFNHRQATLACLRALAAHPPAAACAGGGLEIIVVDDGSSDGTDAWMAQVEGLRYHRRAANGGFIAACNDGAALARGEYLVFLNNDTIPQPGWLDALLDIFATHPDTGMAVAQLLYPDGRLQEAGGVTFDDGAAWSYGRFEAADDPRYAYVREADYGSGAALAIPRALFAEAGGFDPRYAPAYYEDTDLAFAVRALGRKLRYQPRSRVLHDEGTTAGTDTGSGTKASQVRNQAVFAHKWADALRGRPAPGTLPTPALLHAGQRNVLVVDEAVPRPDHDSASLRQFNLIRMLRDGGAHVAFLPTGLAHGGDATVALQQLGVETWYAPYAPSAPAWLRRHAQRFDVIVLTRHHLASAFLPLLRRHAPRARLVFDTVDLHHLRERRGAQLAGDAAALRAAGAVREHELAAMAAADVTLVVSAEEQAQLAREAPGVRVELLSNLHEVAGPGLDFDARADLVFVGGFRHPPNVDAVLWFAREVFPAIRQALPAVRFHCIGAAPPPEVRALGEADGIVVHGHVADIAPYMDGARVAVAPLRFGAGVKGKVNLSMAHGQPVVATTCAVEGMYLRDGVDVVVADTAEAFAAAVVALYRDRGRWQRQAHAGLENVARHFSPQAAAAAVQRVFFL
ncbi:glycosyltransferase [Pseudoxanthomonas koreensis]|uniref:glycosyltransferase n=1 Tax=Pseudoxanthomonas koreensis TaxID=266061 RepID=UPI0013908071|nr:glycosyltransferase [Pseudoxanthomonas koreensis]KAF1694306.1 glycosyl transferase [Pseudoxanthomonas koreensis]